MNGLAINLLELSYWCHDRLTVVYKSDPAMQARRRTIGSFRIPVTDESLLFKGGDCARSDISEAVRRVEDADA